MWRILAILASVLGVSYGMTPQAMPWLCLERCGGNASSIAANIKQIKEQASTLHSVSFELFNLGENETLVKNNLTDVVGPLRGVVSLYPMISSYPYPKDFIFWMRSVFANPDRFLDQLIEANRVYQGAFRGFNFDWEPQAGLATPTDGEQYAAFLDYAAKRLHAENLEVTVDMATWSPVWNLTLLGQTDIDGAIFMSTYTDNATEWDHAFNEYIAAIPPPRRWIGLETLTRDNVPYNHTVLSYRFQRLARENICRIGLWKSPIPSIFLPFLQNLTCK